MAMCTKKWNLWRFILCSMFVVGLLATFIQDVNADDQDVPSESQCRPYIEKALKDLEAGETHTAAEDADSKEGDSGSQEDNKEDAADEDSSVEILNEDGDDSGQTEEQNDEPSVEVADEPYVDGDANDDSESAPGDSKEGSGEKTQDHDDVSNESAEKQEADDGEKSEEGDSKEDGKQQGDSNEASAEDNKTDEDDADGTASVETQEDDKEDSENKSDESGEKSEDGEDSKEEQDEEVSNKRVKRDLGEQPEEQSNEEGDSKEVDDDDSKEKSEADSKEDSKEDEKASNEEEDEDSKQQSDDDSKEAAGDKDDDSKEADGDKDDDSKESNDDSKEADTKDDDSKEEVDNKEDDSQEKSEEDSKDKDDDSKETAEEKDGDSQETAEEKDGDSQETTENKDDSKETVEDKESKETVEEKDSKETVEDKDSKETDEEKDSKETDDKSEESTEKEQVDAPGEESDESEEAEHPEEDLLMELDIPENLRPKEHITQILRLGDESTEGELLIDKSADIILRELKRLYDNAIKPLEILYKYRDLSNRHYGDPEIFSKPLILFMGPWSGGKSSLINYLTDNEFTEWSLRTGAEPSPAYFNILMHGKEPQVLDGTQLAADWTFSGLQKFGQGLEERLRGLKYPSKLLEKVNIVEIPGILEVRKQVSRVFPFNDACQWFIDRADIIFLVYDPSKLDVGPETEAILDQLKGRESQTRIILNKADQVKPEELMRVQSALIWNISPLMSSAQPPVMYTTSLWSLPYEGGAPVRLLQAQERVFLKDLREAIDKRVDNKIASARRFAVRVRNHAKMVDCYLTTYYNHKTIFANKKVVAEAIIEHPQNYHIYEGLSTLTNISRYDLPDPETYRDFFRLNPLYDFQQLSATCTYFRGCPINRLDIAIAYDLPELVGKYKKMVESATPQGMPKS